MNALSNDPEIRTYQKLTHERGKSGKMLSALRRIRRTSVKETFHGDVEQFQKWLDSFVDEVIEQATQ